ncbi:MAG TPA: hypothetical protein VN181_14430 [Thermoanaerobaculia bacterium]|nr:hypothetical protein [Thermoanaerobaculia bacterium]
MIVAVLFAWLLLSALMQIRVDVLQRWRRFDVLHLIPQYNFFAPVPGMNDFHVLYRDCLPDGAATDWAEITAIAPRHWWNAVWHPHRRQRKAIFDVTTTFAKELQLYGAEKVPLSVPYLLLLNYVSAQDHRPAATSTQFLLMMSYGGHEAAKEPDVMFLSTLHGLDTAGGWR